MKARLTAIDRAEIRGGFDPDDPDRYLCDIHMPSVAFVFVASVAPDDAVTFSPQAPPWLTGAMAERLTVRVLRARSHGPRNCDERAAVVSARRRLVLDGLVKDAGRRRRGQVEWVATELLGPWLAAERSRLGESSN